MYSNSWSKKVMNFQTMHAHRSIITRTKKISRRLIKTCVLTMSMREEEKKSVTAITSKEEKLIEKFFYFF